MDRQTKAIKRFVIPDWCILPISSGVGDPSTTAVSSAGEQFPNWGGEEAAGSKTNHYKSIEAVWREANSSTTCSDSSQAHATWVGLGGDPNWEQDGANLIQDGSVQTEGSHYTWWEIINGTSDTQMVATATVNIKDGDQIDATTSSLDGFGLVGFEIATRRRASAPVSLRRTTSAVTMEALPTLLMSGPTPVITSCS